MGLVAKEPRPKGISSLGLVLNKTAELEWGRGWTEDLVQDHMGVSTYPIYV